MREIKFRAWDGRNTDKYGQSIEKRMKYGIENTYDDENGDFFGDVLSDREFIVEQFTGLLDKNGREIYEGDIIRVGQFYGADEDEPESWLEDSVHLVVWGGSEYPAFHLEPNWSEESNDFADIIVGGFVQMQVIGNLHENPDLLK